MEIFEIWVLEAKNIASKNKTGRSSPYCKLRTNFNRQTYRSLIAPKSLTPYWGQCFRFFPGDTPPTGSVSIVLYHKSTFLPDNSVGELIVDISKYADGNEHDFWEMLQNEPKKMPLEGKGEIHVRVRFLTLEGESPPLTNPRIVSPNFKVSSEIPASPELRKSPSNSVVRRKDASFITLNSAQNPASNSSRNSGQSSAQNSDRKPTPNSTPNSPPPQPVPAPSPSVPPASLEGPAIITNNVSNFDQAAVLRVEDKYELGARIGSGAFSTVFRARNKFTDEEVAIKVVNKLSVKKRELEMLSREINIIKKLKHPNIVRLLDIFDGAQKIYIVLELIEGGELFDRIIDSGGYSENDARLLISQVLEGIGYMHRNGVVHRDLKPENLLCLDATHVKIADFGMSKDIMAMGNCKTAVGTPNYIAPEIIQGVNKVAYDSACDIWSIGVLTYVLLSGFTPFWGESQKQLFERITNADFDFPSPEFDHISQNAKDFITRLLTLNPDSRPTAEQALSHPWIKVDVASPHKLTEASKNLALMRSGRVSYGDSSLLEDDEGF